ncbi:MAG: DUF262 domain-containing HNH endonuclease family protein [Campylobacteraceae bacterium]|jgi:uncharacterized protein with ParB-like and HNH nuclease domain|nr:DUF262 domain-containing HNH endonuclease family protein [Campylobacteraceae bacterium]
MKVEAHNVLVETLFKKGQFIIPDYQREYGWDREHVKELLDNIDETPTEENYFIGHMVFEGEYNGNNFEVVDGQQRITTLTILLCSIRDRFIELGENNLAEAIHTSYIFGKDKNFNDYVVLENKMPYPFLQAYVQSKPADKVTAIQPIKSGEKKIRSCFDQINKYLNSFDKEQLIVLRDKILKLEVIFVAADDQVDASTIFMTINATGKDLSPLDLVKNYIFNLYPKLPHLNEPNDTWMRIISNTHGSVKFLNNFFASRYKKVSDKRIFKEFLLTVKKEGKENIKSFLQNVESDSIVFRKIIKPKPDDWSKNDYDIFESINAITNIFKIEVANTFLISLLRSYNESQISKAYLLKALSFIERFHFVNNAVCSNRSSGYNEMYAKQAKQLFEVDSKDKKHRIINELGKYLEKKLPNKEMFTSHFDNKLYFLSTSQKQKTLVQYALNKIERKANSNAVLIQTSLEHVYPEKHKGWLPLKKSDLIKNVGNLVLLDQGLNSIVGNKIYALKKQQIVTKSHIESTKKVFLNHEQWSDEEILERRNNLIDELYINIWK